AATSPESGALSADCVGALVVVRTSSRRSVWADAGATRASAMIASALARDIHVDLPDDGERADIAQRHGIGCDVHDPRHAAEGFDVVDHAAEDGVAAVEARLGREADEELRTARVLARERHAERTRPKGK